MNALVAVDDGDAIAEYVSNDPAMWSRVTLPDGSTKSHPSAYMQFPQNRDISDALNIPIRDVLATGGESSGGIERCRR